MHLDVDKSKLVFARKDNNDTIKDEAFETKAIGYYKDVWLRFKRGKASYVAFIVILVIFFFTLFGPIFRNYTLYKDFPNKANKLGNLPPKMGLIFQGTKTIEKTSAEILKLGDIVIKIKDVNPSSGKTRVVVDAYRYQNYVVSIMNEEGVVPVYNLTEAEYLDALERGAVIKLHSVTSSGIYRTQLDYFRYALNQAPEDIYFWFGTDSQGRDYFTSVWVGCQVSFLMAIVITVINLAIGTVIGSIMGYYGGTLDLIFERFIDIISALPFLAILSLLIIHYGQSTLIVVIAFTATGWIGAYARTRSQFYRYKNREYVLAARSFGAKDRRIMFKHILPNSIGTMITTYALTIPGFIMSETTYSFLGILNYSDRISLGMLLANGQAVMRTFPHLVLFPAILLAILMVSFNIFGNGLRDAFNPSLRGVEE